jgi:hypothetical protein
MTKYFIPVLGGLPSTSEETLASLLTELPTLSNKGFPTLALNSRQTINVSGVSWPYQMPFSNLGFNFYSLVSIKPNLDNTLGFTTIQIRVFFFGDLMPVCTKNNWLAPHS